MVLNDFKQMLGIDGINITEEQCCCIKSSANSKEAQKAVVALKFEGELGERLFDCFNSIQNKSYAEQLRKHKYAFVFMSENGGVSRFYSVYKIIEEMTCSEAIKRNLIPVEYNEKIEIVDNNSTYFKLQKIITPKELERRMLINFKSGQSNAIKFVTASKYIVSQIEPAIKATEFIDYKSVHLTYNELKVVIEDPKWKDMLSRFGGVYLIHDSNTGKNYVGAAYNKGGILGRWKNYADYPTGGDAESGNVRLVELLQDKPEYAEKYFHFSILEVLPLSKRDKNKMILDAESRWKTHLGTRIHGLNDN